MSSSHRAYSHDRGRDRNNDDRRDSRSSSGSNPSRPPHIKCRNFDPVTCERIAPCSKTCRFVHPEDPAWKTARTPSAMGPPPVPDRSRDGGWSRPASTASRSSYVEKSAGSGWGSSTGSGWGKSSDSFGTNTGDRTSTSTVSDSGWGRRDEAPTAPKAPAAWDEDAWGSSADTTSAAVRISPAAGAESASSANTKNTQISKSISDLEWGTSGDWGVPESIAPTATPGASGSTSLPVYDATLVITSTTPTDQPYADKGWSGMADKPARQEQPRKDSLPVKSLPGLPTAGTPQLELPTTKLTLSSNFKRSSLDTSHSRRSSRDNVIESDKVIVTPLERLGVSLSNKLEGLVKEVPKWPTLAPTLSSSNPATPLPSNSATPKPTLTIDMPKSPDSMDEAAVLSLLLQSPMPTPLLSSTNRGPPVTRPPAQQAWGGHIDVLSRAVTAQTERLRLSDAFNDRQRLMSRINKKAGRSGGSSISSVSERQAASDADEKAHVSKAQLLEKKEGEPHWWPTPRASVGQEEAISSLENDVERLQQLLNVQDMKDDGMEIDVQDGVNLKELLKRRKAMLQDVKEMLEHISERLERTEGSVNDQKQILGNRISRILGEAHPPSTAPGADGLAKMEELRERFEELEARMATYLPDLNRRIQLDKRRAHDLQVLHGRYKELLQKKRDLAARKKKLTDDAQDFLASMMARPTLAEQVLERTTNTEAQERMVRVVVPKLRDMAETYRANDLAWVDQRQAIIDAAVEAWKNTRELERTRRGEEFLQALKNNQAIQAVDMASKEIERRWSEVVSVQRIARRKSPVIRIPGPSGSQLGFS